MLRWRMVAGVFALASGLAACGGSSSGGTQAVSAKNQAAGNQSSAPAASSSAESSSSDTIAGLTADDHGSKDVAGRSAVTINADSYYFEPSVLHGSAGQKLTLTVHNEGAASHNFTLQAQNINSDLDPGKDVTVHVTFPSSGVLSFYCEYHKAKGMAGGLLVSGDKAAAPGSSSTSGGGAGWG